MEKLTERQTAIISFISNFVKKHLQFPTWEELALNFGMKSRHSAFDHMERLVRKGWLVKFREKSRASRYTLSPEARERFGMAHMVSTSELQHSERSVARLCSLVSECRNTCVICEARAKPELPNCQKCSWRHVAQSVLED